MRVSVLALLLGCAALAGSQDFDLDLEQPRQVDSPPVDGAKCVLVSLRCPGFPGLDLMQGRGGSNRAWLLPGGKDGVAELLLFGGWRVKVEKTARFGDINANWPLKPGADFVGTWWPSEDEPPPPSPKRLATCGYCARFMDYFHGHSLPALRDSMLRLAKSAPDGWAYRSAMEAAARLVDARLKGEIPELSGEGLGDSDRSQARALATAPDAVLPSPLRFWVFPPSTYSPGTHNRPPALPPALQDILARWLDCVPLLLALWDDHCLTGWFRPANYFLMFNYSTDGRAAKDAFGRYQELPGLASRGEIARQCLATLMPSERWRTPGPDELRAWWLANKDKPPRQLAFLYLRQGDKAQRRGALEFLLDGLTDAEVAEVEPLLLREQASFDDDPYLVVDYVRHRGAKAKAFVEEFANRSGKVKEPSFLCGFRARNLAEMRMHVSCRSLETLVDGLVSGELQCDAQASAELYHQLGTLGLDGSVRRMLEASIRTTDLGLRQNLLSMINTPRRNAKLKNPPRFADNAALWGKLLADLGRNTAYDQRLHNLLNGLYASDRSAIGLSHALYEQYNNQLFDAIRFGKPLPEIPDAANVGQKRRQELAKQLSATALATFSPSEMLAVGEMAEGDATLNAKLLPYANIIHEVELDSVFNGEFDAFKALEGKALSRITVARLAKAVSDNPALGASCQIYREPCLGGVAVKMRHQAQEDVKTTRFLLSADLRGSLSCRASLGRFSVERRDGKALVMPNKDPRGWFSSTDGRMVDTEVFWRQVEKALTAALATESLNINIQLMRLSGN